MALLIAGALQATIGPFAAEWASAGDASAPSSVAPESTTLEPSAPESSGTASAAEADAPDASSAAELAKAVQARYEGIRDLRATFVQISEVRALDRVERSSGEVMLRRPGRMRWEYRAPEPRVLVADGETLRLFVPSDNQLQIAPMGEGMLSSAAIGFLMGEGRLDEGFDAEHLVDAMRSERGLRLRPLDDAGFEILDLWLDPKTLRLVESRVVDLVGNTTRVRFDDVVENAGVGLERFEIAVPDGTDVIDLRE